jgi:hypothetical protein
VVGVVDRANPPGAAMSGLLVSVFTGPLEVGSVLDLSERSAVVVSWEVDPGPEGPTLRFDLAVTRHPQVPTEPAALGALLHVMCDALMRGLTLPTAMPPTAPGGA